MQNWFYEQMSMYTAYHRDERNQLTHHIGVPLIVFSLLVLSANVTVFTLGTVSFTLAALLMSALLFLYIYCAPLVGTVAVIFYGVLLLLAEIVVLGGDGQHYAVFGVCFVVGWIIQFVGHGFEGRRPALFDNLLQIFVAPAFLIAEVLFRMGLETRLKAEVSRRSHKYLPSGQAAANTGD